MTNTTLLIIAELEIPVAHILITPGIGRSIHTLIRLPNQHGLAVRESAQGFEAAAVYWPEETGAMHHWEFMDTDLQEQNRGVTADQLKAELIALNMIPDPDR